MKGSSNLVGRDNRTMRRIPPRLAFRQAMIWTLVIAILAMGFYSPDVKAMLAPAVSPTSESVADTNRMGDLRKVQTILESKIVRQRLEDFGLTPEEINARLTRLSDKQLHQLATEVDALIPGGNGLGIVIALLVIAILAVILVYLLNHRIVITKESPEK